MDTKRRILILALILIIVVMTTTTTTTLTTASITSRLHREKRSPTRELIRRAATASANSWSGFGLTSTTTKRSTPLDGEDGVNLEDDTQLMLNLKANNKEDNNKSQEPEAKVYDILGNQLKLEGNRTVIVLQNQARDLGFLTLKAILLGPLVGLTLKAALFRGLLWAVGAYFMHLFFPSLLSSIGLGTGLVGFARSAQGPDYGQMLLKAAVNFLETKYSVKR